MLDFITLSYVFSAVMLVGFSALVLLKYRKLQQQFQAVERLIAEHKSSKTL